MTGQPTLLHTGAPTFDYTKAACRNIEEPEIFFPLRADDPAEQAKAICARCPVQPACAQYALDRPTEAGVWGGLTESQRNAIRRRQQRCPNCGAARRCADQWICEDTRLSRLEEQ